MSNVLPFSAPPLPKREPPPYPTDLRPVLLCGWLVIAGVFGGFGTWAAFAPLSSAAIAPGIVVVDSNRKSVQHLEGGVPALMRSRSDLQREVSSARSAPLRWAQAR